MCGFCNCLHVCVVLCIAGFVVFRFVYVWM